MRDAPAPELCRALRESAGLTLAAMAELAGLSAWQRWQEYEAGRRRIDAARWELVLLKLGQHPTQRLVQRRRATAP